MKLEQDAGRIPVMSAGEALGLVEEYRIAL